MQTVIATCALAAVLAGAPRSATAQAVATEEPRTPPSGVQTAQGLSAGLVGSMTGPTGWFLREDVEQLERRSESGLVLGEHVDVEGWRAKPDWGFSLPVLLVGGIRRAPLYAMVGAGCNLLLLDHIAGETRFGAFAPLASVRLGFDVEGFQLGIDARGSRRWLIGAEDRTQWQLGVFVMKNG